MEKISLRSLTLKHGSHKSPEDGLCVMEAVAYFAGEPHSDKPHCACPVLTNYMIRLNDAMTEDERKLLKPYIKKLIGTRDSKSAERLKILVRAAVVEVTPRALRLTGKPTLIKQAELLENLPENASYEEMRKECNAAASADASAAYAASAAASAAYAAAYAADAADAAYAAYTAAAAAAYAAYAASAASASASAYAAYAASAAASAAAASAAARKPYWKIALKALDRALKVK